MTEAETLQSGRDLIATEIMGWKLKQPWSLFADGPLWDLGQMTVIYIDNYRPDLNTEQSLAVKRRLVELGWCWEITSPYTQAGRGHEGTDLYLVEMAGGIPRMSEIVEDKDELMAIFKACVKASEWIRDNQTKEEKNG